MKYLWILLINLILILTNNISSGFAKEKYTEQDINCLAEAVYFEARSESRAGQLAVAQVILNRVRSSKFPNTVCSVIRSGKYNKSGKIIKNKCAFSYWCDGKTEEIANDEAYDHALEISYMAIDGIKFLALERAFFFHSTKTKPYWVNDYKFVKQIDNHLFYEYY
jgi:spore germination cell wall hydrolase CwlJ-like protein